MAGQQGLASAGEPEDAAGEPDDAASQKHAAEGPEGHHGPRSDVPGDGTEGKVLKQRLGVPGRRRPNGK